MIADIFNVQAEAVRNGPLDAQTPALHVGSAEVAVHTDNATRWGSCPGGREGRRHSVSVAASDGSSGARVQRQIRAADWLGGIEVLPIGVNRADTGTSSVSCSGKVNISGRWRYRCYAAVIVKRNAGGNGAQPEKVADRVGHVVSDGGFVDDAARGSDYGFAVSKNVPGEAQAGR